MRPRQADNGPFDIIGDIHGCLDELLALLQTLGYDVDLSRGWQDAVRVPEGRTPLFLGDLVNRGPDTPGVLRVVMAMVASGRALCVAGNHDVMLQEWIEGRRNGKEDNLAESRAQLKREPKAFLRDIAAFVQNLPRYLVLDDGALVIAHAGLPEEYHGKTSAAALDFAVNGRKNGNPDEHGGETRYRWAEDYQGEPFVVYGHYAAPMVSWLNGTVCLDTGCVYGGRLTALRYPEREIVSVPAARAYKDSKRWRQRQAELLAVVS